MLLQISKRVLNSPLLQAEGRELIRAFSREKHITPLTSTISLITPEKIEKNKNPLQVNYSGEGRPLSLLLCWLMAKDKAVSKYVNFYMEHGFDVLTVRISPFQLLWPKSCVPIVKDELLPILENLGHEKRLVHGFSVGGYVFGQLLRYAHDDLSKYQKVIDAFKGHVWDSVCDVEGTAIGVSKSLFPTNNLFQQKTQKSIELYMEAMYNVATKYYNESHEFFYNKPLKCPALFLCSRTDQISALPIVFRVQETWVPLGVTSTTKIWENTPHVGHMARHPDEYKQTVRAFIENIGINPMLINTLREKDIPQSQREFHTQREHRVNQLAR